MQHIARVRSMTSTVAASLTFIDVITSIIHGSCDILESGVDVTTEENTGSEAF